MMKPGQDITQVAIVGARGQMGALFSRAFHKAGLLVTTLDRPYDPDGTGEALRAALAGAELVILSVPVTAMRAVAETVAPHMKPGCILADVCSVKVHPVSQMLGAYAGPVVGTHPLFGPVIPEGFEPRVAVTPGRETPGADRSEGSAAEAVARLLARAGFSPFASTAEEHDRAMATVQGLNFITTVAYLAAARQTPGIEKFLTPSFGRRLEAARKMLTQDRELFQVISEDNPFMQETVRQFAAYLDIAAGGDLDLLSARASWWWRDKA
ncbi:MAG: prephenate dehydrogenase/arogenate dehydrogenase family protein [Deltaproteobacteria bacterium HGW-Deltaproteobacteria-8]|jgi:prephenate dehydrogenase|nr:MAG: prephenate dehydrogenase/arogenate dehydrogenase family protein [Deltaproteobacteria bacterium HGW-Deltaproteobacteria-8]